MKLIVTTPLALVTEADDVAHLRAEDDSGAFGILPGHADFLTALAFSVVSWRDSKGAEHHLAVKGGMLEVHGGNAISIATRKAIAGDDLAQLETDVIDHFRRERDEEQVAHADAQRLYVAAIREICRFLRSERAPSIPGGSGSALHDGVES